MINKNKDIIVIFDGDDTLWKTQELYDIAKKRFERLMNRLGFDTAKMIQELDTIDSKRVKILQFSKERFLESMLMIYAYYCGKYNKEMDEKIEGKIRHIVSIIFSPPKLYNDTISTLKLLHKNNITLFIYTAGETEAKKNKLECLGEKFISYFKAIFITDIKNVVQLKSLVKTIGVNSKHIWVIGNSCRSDINPALKLGLKAILIPRGVWEYEKEAPLSNRFFMVKSLKDASKIVLSHRDD